MTDCARCAEAGRQCRPCYAADYYQKNKAEIRRKQNEHRRKRTPAEVAERNARYRDWRSDWRLRRYYNITQEDYDAMLATQGGVCAICGLACKSGKRLAVDHDHACCPGRESCGKCIRGLLCYRCNSSLGFLDEDIERCKAMANYLIERIDKK